MAMCEDCPLNDPANAFVPSRIPASPKIIVVGEAPGFQEGQRGIPFVGPSGKLLNEVLKGYKYKPSEVAYTNVCLCRPPGNATPPKAAVLACRQRLLGELAASGAKGILALGGTAASSLVDDGRTITSLRVGPAKAVPASLRGTSIERVVPTWHPAYCLRNADAFPAMVSDIGKLQDSKREAWQAPKHYVIDDPELAISFLNENSPEVCVLDTEVGIEKDISFAHPNEYDMLCVGLQWEKGVAYVIGENALNPPLRLPGPDESPLFSDLPQEQVDRELQQRVRDALKAFLKRTKIIAHNGKFDLSALHPLVGALELWFDTMLAHYALDERVGAQLHGLKVLAVELLGAPQYDLEIATYVPRGGNYSAIPRPILYKYNAYDVSCTWDLFELFSEKLDRDDVRRVHDLMVRASNQLMYLELNGIAVDIAYSNALQSGYQARLFEIESSFRTLTDTETFNPRSPKQVKEFLYGQGIRVESTNVDVLTALHDRIDPLSNAGRFVAELLRYRREQKLFSTYVEGLRKRLYRGRIHTTYLLHGTTSGRLASRNPNLQNIVRDKDIRRQFSVSKPDHVFLQADYKQAEGRVIATLAQDEYLRSRFANPSIDLFSDMADQIYGPGTWGKEERVRVKAFFYGLSYGRQAYSIAMEYGLTPREGEKLMGDFMALIPATVRWQQETKRKVLNHEDLITPFGRKRRFHLITDDNQKDVLNEALSYLPQSTASDICLSALIRLRPALRGLGWIRLTIHDALVVECPKQNQERVVDLMTEIMIDEGRKFTDYVPFEVDISYGASWGEL